MQKLFLPIILSITSITLLIMMIGICAKQDSLEKSLRDIAAGSPAEENTRLASYLATALYSAGNKDNNADKVNAEIIYVPEYHEKTTVKEVEVAKPVYINNEWREFESAAALMEWAEEHLVKLWIVGDKIADCDDYASRLQLEAFRDGYLLSVQIINNGMLNGKNVSNYNKSHMGNLAMLGNDIYFIEPQPDYFRVVFVCHRD